MGPIIFIYIYIERESHTQLSVANLVGGAPPILKLLPLSSISMHGGGGISSTTGIDFYLQRKSTTPTTPSYIIDLLYNLVKKVGGAAI